jgi:Domain of unknown function (DUF4168)
MKFSVRRNFVWALLVGCSLAATNVLQAAEQARKPASSAPATISDRELDAFVKAYVEYQKIRANYAPALKNAKDPGQKKQIEREANAKVKRALESNGLSANRYNQIFATVNANEPLRKKVLKQVEEQRRNS